MATIVSQVNNPITGVFGNGLVQVFGASGTWTVPEGVNNVRVRIFGAGGGGGGGGGGNGTNGANAFVVVGDDSDDST